MTKKGEITLFNCLSNRKKINKEEIIIAKLKEDVAKTVMATTKNPYDFNLEKLPELIKTYYGGNESLMKAAEQDGIVAKITKVWNENKKYLGMIGIAFAAIAAKNILDGYIQKLRFKLSHQSEYGFNKKILSSMNVEYIKWKQLDGLRAMFGDDTAIIKVRYIDMPIIDDVIEVASHDLALTPKDVTSIEKLMKACLELGQITGEYGKLCNLMLTGANVRTQFTEENSTSFFNKIKAFVALDVLAPDSYLTIADLDAFYSYAIKRNLVIFK